MNKLLIVLLAVCLVSVHAFVKRDTEKQDGTDIMNNLNELSKNIGDKFKEVLNPESLKKEFNQLVDNINKGFQDFNKKIEESKKNEN